MADQKCTGVPSAEEIAIELRKVCEKKIKELQDQVNRAEVEEQLARLTHALKSMQKTRLEHLVGLQKVETNIEIQLKAIAEVQAKLDKP